MKNKLFALITLVAILALAAMPLSAQASDENPETALEQALALQAERNPAPAQPLSTPLWSVDTDYPLLIGVDDAAIPAYRIEPATAANIPAFTGYQVWGAAYDVENDIVYFNNGSTLYEWPVGGAVTTLGTITYSAAAMPATGLAFYDGTLYAVKNIANEAVYTINLSTLEASLYIDYSDADFDFGGFDADPNTGDLYATSDDIDLFGPGLYRINLDGSATLIAAYPAGQTDIDGLAVSDDGIAYLVIDEPGDIFVYDLNTNAYLAPVANPWATFETFSAGAWLWENFSTIDLTKTVGTDPNTCATTDAIVVEVGTDVTYCYEVENTGSSTLNFHSLIDSELGTILNDFPYALAPGASAFLTQTATIYTDTVNGAMWTAYNTDMSYKYDDSAPYNFIDISSTGAPLDLSDDGEANVTLPFRFFFYGAGSDQVRIGNNGGMLFNATTGDVGITNSALPNAAHPLAIFPFWDDIDSDTGNVYYETQGAAPNRRFIVQWHERPHFSNVGSATFQVILFEGSNNILFQYADLNFGDAAYDYGASATVGLNKDASEAVQYSFDTAVLADAMSILWMPTGLASASDTATVTILRPAIDVAPSSIAGSQILGTSADYTLTIGNVGGGLLKWRLGEVNGTESLPGPAPAPDRPAPSSNLAASGFTSLVEAASAGLTVPQAAANPPAAFPSGPAGAGVIFYDERTVFNIYHPGLPVEDFEDGLWGDATFGACPAPWDASTDNACFAAGGILPGIRFQDNPLNEEGGGGPDGLVGIGAGFAGAISKNIVANTFVDSFEIVFDPPVTAAGMDLTHYYADGATVGITLYDASDTAIITTTATATNAGTFWGVFSATPISRIHILSTVSIGDGAEGVDNVVFGEAGVCSILDNIPWATFTPLTGTLPGGSSTDVAITFDTTGLTAGATYTGTLCIHNNDPATLLVRVPLTLTVVPQQFGVMLSADQALTVDAGTSAMYTLSITNTGNVADTFDLSATGAWAATPSLSSISLDAGASGSFTVSVVVPLGVADGDMDVTTVTATSQTQPAATDSAALTTTAQVDLVKLYLPLILKR